MVKARIVLTESVLQNIPMVHPVLQGIAVPLRSVLMEFVAILRVILPVNRVLLLSKVPGLMAFAEPLPWGGVRRDYAQRLLKQPVVQMAFVMLADRAKIGRILRNVQHPPALGIRSAWPRVMVRGRVARLLIRVVVRMCANPQVVHPLAPVMATVFLACFALVFCARPSRRTGAFAAAQTSVRVATA